MKKEIFISELEISYIQKVYFEYEMAKNIVRYLISMKYPEEEIEYYFSDAIQKFAIMELAKAEIILFYCGKNIKNYHIYFDECKIEYKI